MIEFQHVTAGYGDGSAVVRDVSFRIEKGEFVSLVGTNGAGKSTTMRLCNGLLKPTTGAVLLDGTPTTELKTSQIARRAGFLFQNPDRQICNATVRDELLFNFKVQGADMGQAQRRVDDIIERFGFDPLADPFLLNRGTRQLLALASVVVCGPEVLLLDEPTTGLDFCECLKVMDYVRELNEKCGTTVVMVCHDMEVVADYAKRLIVMTAGRVVADGATFEVLRDRESLERADVIPPQVVEISTRLVEHNSSLALGPVACANTLDELTSALVGFADSKERVM